MLRFLQQFITTLVFALFASQASAMFIQADWLDPTEPGVGTNRYSYSFNDPVNSWDKNGNCTDSACDYESYTSAWSDQKEDLEDQLREVERQISSNNLNRDEYLDLIGDIEAKIEEARVNANISVEHHRVNQLGSMISVPDRLGQVVSRLRSKSPSATGATKPVSLPSYRKVKVDMDHILERHMVGGSAVNAKGSRKDVFPEHMTARDVEKAIVEGYRVAKKVKTQGERVRVQGGGIEMWVNTRTKTIETAYPLK